MVWARMTGQGVPGGWGGSPCHDVLSWGSLTLLWGSISCRLGSWPLPRLPHTLGLPPHPLTRTQEGRTRQGLSGCPHKAAKALRGPLRGPLLPGLRRDSGNGQSAHQLQCSSSQGCVLGVPLDGTRVRGQGQRCVAVFPDLDGAGVRALHGLLLGSMS